MMAIRRVGLYLLMVTIAPLSIGMEWELLASMREAAQELNYRGEFMHRRGDSTNVYSITHQFDLNSPVELLRQLDGDMVEVLREGDKTVCYYPQGSESAMNYAVPAAPFTLVNELNLTKISENYQATTVGMQKVAGFNTRVILLESDRWRYSQKLWLEEESHLLLQSEIMDTDGSILEQFRFTRIEIGVVINKEELVPSLMFADVRQQMAYKTNSAEQVNTDFESKLEWVPDGFYLSHSNQKLDKNGWKEQRTFTDGLVAFSVFVEKTISTELQQSALAKMGATTALMRYFQHHSITVIGEIPGETAKKIAEELIVPNTSI